ncbi:hypothetical protein [Acetobacter oeni]|uniref:hypothetical protein n=1 Tax=Acetobacter oeni TaxID=304077 RepID=UPI001569A15B|nr:hypothetical protein [Acetobacter oeni]
MRRLPLAGAAVVRRPRRFHHRVVQRPDEEPCGGKTSTATPAANQARQRIKPSTRTPGRSEADCSSAENPG